MTKNIYPLGTVLYLQEGNEKIMIIGRGVVFNDQETNEDVYTDYMGCIYPSGVNPENAIFFNQENIDEVIYEGYKDESEKRFLQLYEQWESGLTIKKNSKISGEDLSRDELQRKN